MMGDPSLYTYDSPLKGYGGLKPLSEEKAADGKSFVNPPAESRSEAYSRFSQPITNDIRGGFDIHIYFLQSNEFESKFAHELHERIRREFPELRIYKVWDRPIGPHPLGMQWTGKQDRFESAAVDENDILTLSSRRFEVNLFTPEQFGAFVPWLVINRGPLSALVHPNTGDDVRDHSQRATWMGQPLPLNLGGLREALKKRKETEEANV